MSNLIIDSITGTILVADGCYIIDDSVLSLNERDIIENGSDSEVCELGAKRGLSIMKMMGDSE